MVENPEISAEEVILKIGCTSAEHLLNIC